MPKAGGALYLQGGSELAHRSTRRKREREEDALLLARVRVVVAAAAAAPPALVPAAVLTRRRAAVPSAELRRRRAGRGPTVPAAAAAAELGRPAVLLLLPAVLLLTAKLRLAVGLLLRQRCAAEPASEGEPGRARVSSSSARGDRTGRVGDALLVVRDDRVLVAHVVFLARVCHARL